MILPQFSVAERCVNRVAVTSISRRMWLIVASGNLMNAGWNNHMLWMYSICYYLVCMVFSGHHKTAERLFVCLSCRSTAAVAAGGFVAEAGCGRTADIGR